MSGKVPQVESDATNDPSSRYNDSVLSDIPRCPEPTFWQDEGIGKHVYPDESSTNIPRLGEYPPQEPLPHEETHFSTENEGFPIRRSLMDRLAVAPQKIRWRAKSFDLTNSLRELKHSFLDRRQQVSSKADEEEQRPESALCAVVDPNLSAPQPPAFEFLVTPPADDKPVEFEGGHLTDEEISRRTAVRKCTRLRRWDRNGIPSSEPPVLSRREMKKRSTSVG